MKRFLITETQATWVTWTYSVEAESAETAKEKYREGDYVQVDEPTIGESIDGYEQIVEVEDNSDD